VTTRTAPAAGSHGRAPTVPSYSAVRTALPPGPPIDPFVLAGTDGTVLADGDRVVVGIGRAVVLDLPEGLGDAAGVDAVVRAVASVACDDRLAASAGVGHPVVAMGALPFERSAPGRLVVPELTYVVSSAGVEWVTVVADDAGTLPDPDDPDALAALRTRLSDRAAAAPQRGSDPSRSGVPVVVPRSGDAEFEGAVATAVDAIRRGDLVKVVLARAVDVELPADVDVVALLHRWSALEPSCTLFSVPTPGGQFVGASPELLVERSGDQVCSRPLAGTTDRDHGAASALPPALLDSAKDGEEHRLVVDAIRSELDPVTVRLTVPDRPELVHLHTITHLGTTVRGTLRPTADGNVPSALHLVARLHPTPAVGGVPRSEATTLIHRLEQVPRGPYAGPVGWIDGAGDGRWMVGIRAMTVDGPSVRLTAGVGIVADSDPRTELEETDLKFRAVYGALAPGAPFDTSATPADASA
jgi:menaquinone-specific isochorismate synthase